MGSSSNWFGRIRRKFVRSSNREIIVIYSNTSPSSHEERADYEVLTREDALSTTSSFRTRERCLTKEDIAAIKIQAFFRGQLVHNINPTHLFSMQTSLFMRKVLQCLHKIWKPPSGLWWSKTIDRQDKHFEHSRAWWSCKHWFEECVWGNKHV